MRDLAIVLVGILALSFPLPGVSYEYERQPASELDVLAYGRLVMWGDICGVRGRVEAARRIQASADPRVLAESVRVASYSPIPGLHSEACLRLHSRFGGER